jgi:predicted dehydrogenase
MKLRMGMIGGGEGSLTGPVHRMAARLDGLAELVCGAFSSDPAVSSSTGARDGLPSARIYDNWQEMIIRESALPFDIRPHFITIVTPNHLHYGPAKMALEAGFHVICDKPLCISVTEAADLQETVERTGRLFCLTHNYTGYPMVKRAREMVLGGELGDVRKVIVEYLQGWLTTPLEKTDNRQAIWRSDPSKAGIAGAMADIGTHAFNLAEYITGQEVKALSASLRSVVQGRVLDDDGTVSLLFGNGMNGTLLASQVATGEENNLSIRIYGEKGGLIWRQMEPNTLTLLWPDAPVQLVRTGTSFTGTGRASAMHTRIPAGHPEGFIEAFANLYRNFMMHIIALNEGRNPDVVADYPGINEGVRGMKFLEAVVASSANGSFRTAL